MVSGNYTYTKNALIALNILYMLVTVVLVAVGMLPDLFIYLPLPISSYFWQARGVICLSCVKGAYAHGANLLESVSVVEGIVAAGVFLFVVAIIGLVGAIRHHQVVLFFYMVVLFLIFLLQFFVSVACLAFNDSQRLQLAQKGWRSAGNETLRLAQRTFDCCGFNDAVDLLVPHPACTKLPCYQAAHDSCPSCWSKLNENIIEALRVCGCIGLFFSFTEIIGIWLAARYRNLKDPRANPNAFL